MKGAILDCSRLNVTFGAVNIYWVLSHFIYLYVRLHIFNTITVKSRKIDRFMLKIMWKHAHFFFFTLYAVLQLFFWLLSWYFCRERERSADSVGLWALAQGKENLKLHTGDFCESQVWQEIKQRKLKVHLIFLQLLHSLLRHLHWVLLVNLQIFFNLTYFQIQMHV